MFYGSSLFRVRFINVPFSEVIAAPCLTHVTFPWPIAVAVLHSKDIVLSFMVVRHYGTQWTRYSFSLCIPLHRIHDQLDSVFPFPEVVLNAINAAQGEIILQVKS